MTATLESTSTSQIATFQVEDLLLGVNIDIVQEINRQLDVTEVPHSPASVRGVINLRGEVVTVVDVRTLLGLQRQEITDECRCVVIHWQDEQVGMLVDRIADILSIPQNEVDPPPANIDGVAGRFFKGVHVLESEILMILNVDQMLEVC